MTQTSGATYRDGPPAEAVAAVLDEFSSQQEPLNLCVGTDEELYAYADGQEEAGPFGLWFANLPEEQRQAASLGAMRTLAVRGELESQMNDEGAGAVELPTQTVAALALRRLDTQLSLRVVGSVGETWYMLRFVCDDVFLREAITPQGFHMLSLIRLDEAEQGLFIDRLQLPETADSTDRPDVDVTVTEAQLEAATLDLTSSLSFLEQTTIIGNLVRVPAVDGAVTSMINVLEDGTLVIGEVAGGTVHYRGATVTDLRVDWEHWADRVADVARRSSHMGLRAHPELLTTPQQE